MRRLYREREVLFAVLWILAYCLVMTPIKARFGWESPWMLLALLIFAACITIFVKVNRLERKYGLAGWPGDMRRYLFFIPMWLLATGNLWDGFSPSHRGMAQAIAVISMILVGYVEEMLFRGFLFKALLSRGSAAAAILVSSLTFGMGHIVNLLTGQAGLETVAQIVFAVSWGFILTMAFYKSGSLIPCIIAHAMIDVFSLFGADTAPGDRICIGATVVVAIVYCACLNRLERKESR